MGDQWFLDEVFIKINGQLHYFWRAVDQDGCELNILVTKKRDKKAANASVQISWAGTTVSGMPWINQQSL